MAVNAPRLLATTLVRIGLTAVLFGPACATESSSRTSDDEDAEEEDPALAALTEVERLEVEREDPALLAPFLDAAQPVEVRRRAALALARSEHIKATDHLLAAIADDDPGVRARGAFGLGQLDLALEEDRPEHKQVRAAVEKLVLFLLDKETVPEVRGAAIRALGRLAVGPGLARLVELAGAPGPDQASAFYALGVSGNRRGPRLSGEPALIAAVERGLGATAVEVRRAAAYASFRQRVAPSAPARALLEKPDDPETTIHLLRAVRDTGANSALAEPALEHADWRVRVEAARTLAAADAVPTEVLVRALEQAVTRLEKRPASAEAHVVAEVCRTLINAPPADTRSALAQAVGRLSSSRPDAGCACAVASDAQQARLSLVKQCAPRWPDERRRRLGVQVAARSMISSREKAAWLATAMKDPDRLVRMDAAQALAQEGTPAAREAILEVLGGESDPAVAGTLLGGIADDQAGELDPLVVAGVVERFQGATVLEDAEPLLQAARLLRGLDGPDAEAARSQLEAHPLAHVRVRAAGGAFGDRAFRPLARTAVPPWPEELPRGAVLQTERGAIHIVFERELAPGTVKNFVDLARSGALDGTPFHRVIPDFVAQGGDPRGDGSGGPGYTIACENHDGTYARGAVGMALAGKDTGGSQFFLTHSEQPHLDGRYTLFARVEDGFEVMDALGPDDRLLSVELAGESSGR